jgi:hypothetical protein
LRDRPFPGRAILRDRFSGRAISRDRPFSGRAILRDRFSGRAILRDRPFSGLQENLKNGKA